MTDATPRKPSASHSTLGSSLDLSDITRDGLRCAVGVARRRQHRREAVAQILHQRPEIRAQIEQHSTPGINPEALRQITPEGLDKLIDSLKTKEAKSRKKAEALEAEMIDLWQKMSENQRQGLTPPAAIRTAATTPTRARGRAPRDGSTRTRGSRRRTGSSPPSSSDDDAGGLDGEGDLPGGVPDSLANFWKELRKTHPLDPGRVAGLARQYERGNLGAKAHLVLAHAPFAVKYATRATKDREWRGDQSFEDYVQAGFIGLIRAAETFDHRKGLQFATYAGRWVAAAIRDAMTDTKSLPLRHDHRKAMGKILQVEEQVLEEGRNATLKELVDGTGFAEHQVLALKRAMELPQYLGQPVSIDEGDAPADGSEVSLQDTIAIRPSLPSGSRDLEPLLSTLSQRQRRVIELRFGLGEAPTNLRLSYSEIGERLDISKQGVQQLEKRAIAKMATQPLPEQIPPEADDVLGIPRGELPALMELDGDGLSPRLPRVARWRETALKQQRSVGERTNPGETRRGMFVPPWERESEEPSLKGERSGSHVDRDPHRPILTFLLLGGRFLDAGQWRSGSPSWVCGSPKRSL